MTRVGAIVLAAGRSSRFRAAGGSATTKLVEKLGGRQIVRMAAEAALASSARPVIVVTGHARTSVEAALAGLDVETAYNPEFASGLASSLKAGLSAMPRDVAGALVLLGDMPWIEARLIDALIAGFLASPPALAAPSHEGRRGNPVLLGRGLFEAAMRLEGDAGARRLIDALKPGELVEINARGPGRPSTSTRQPTSPRLAGRNRRISLEGRLRGLQAADRRLHNVQSVARKKPNRTQQSNPPNKIQRPASAETQGIREPPNANALVFKSQERT